MKFQPINLWTRPRQPDLEKEMEECAAEVAKFRHGDDMERFYLALIAAEKLKFLQFIYYCRTGRFSAND